VRADRVRSRSARISRAVRHRGFERCLLFAHHVRTD
jgi:acetolactate synthase regulatory subunit